MSPPMPEVTKEKDLHHDDNEGGLTIREYIDVIGTENAYDSGRWMGRSIRTASMECLEEDLMGSARAYRRPRHP